MVNLHNFFLISFTDTDLSWLINAGRGKSQFRKKEEIYLSQSLMYTHPSLTQ